MEPAGPQPGLVRYLRSNDNRRRRGSRYTWRRRWRIPSFLLDVDNRRVLCQIHNELCGLPVLFERSRLDMGDLRSLNYAQHVAARKGPVDAKLPCWVDTDVQLLCLIHRTETNTEWLLACWHWLKFAFDNETWNGRLIHSGTWDEEFLDCHHKGLFRAPQFDPPADALAEISCASSTQHIIVVLIRYLRALELLQISRPFAAIARETFE